MLCQDHHTSTLGSGPLQLSTAERQTHPSQTQCRAGLEMLPVHMHSTSLRYTSVFVCSVTPQGPPGCDALSGNTFCTLCQVAQFTWQQKILPHTWLWFFESLCLITWKCGFQMLWELLETLRQQDTTWVKSLTSLFSVYLRIKQNCSPLAEQKEKDCTCPNYLGKSMRL